ncbi:MAG: DUF5681 domain-containing protein, partial [Actinomycetota bacterium]
MANPNPSPATRFKPGQSGNPAGRRRGARDRLSVAFLDALARDFEIEGPGFIERTRIKRPDLYVQLLLAILPRRFTLDDMDAEVVHTDLDERLAGCGLDGLIAARRAALALTCAHEPTHPVQPCSIGHLEELLRRRRRGSS